MIVLSWGVGLQSTLLLEMSAQGELPKIDVAIFSDTGFEHDHSYEVFDFYGKRAAKAGIQVVKIGDQDIYSDTYKKVSLPLFVENTGRQIIRKCTRDYKIRPIQRVIRKHLGVNPRGRLKANLVDLWLGITVDEIERAKPSRVAFINHKFPLLDLGIYRHHCEEWFKSKGLLVPGKSSCKFCPYKSLYEWGQMRENEPDSLRLIADLQDHINGKGMVKLDGTPRNVWFVASGNLLQADFSKAKNQPGELCDGGFCRC